MSSGNYQSPEHVRETDASWNPKSKTDEELRGISDEELKAAHEYLDEAEKKLPERKYTGGFNIKHNNDKGDFEVIHKIDNPDVNSLDDGPFNGVNEEAVNHPQHYRPGPYEAIKVIEAWGMGFNTGNALKYIARYGIKSRSTPKEDLEKAIWYLQREASKYE